MTPLATMLSYQNEAILARFQIDFPDSRLQASEALRELMKYIWLCCLHQKEQQQYPGDQALLFNCVMHDEMSDIDNMWHTFLLFTQDYFDFCQQYLDGIFFHHVPFSGAEEEIPIENYEQELTRYLSYIQKNLGEETLKKWFDA